MHTIVLESGTDFAGWRMAARQLMLGNVVPADVTWTVRGDTPELFPPSPGAPRSQGTFNVSARFIELAGTAILHRDPERFALLYRALWRLREHSDLIHVATDPDIARLQTMAKAVRRDEHKMHAFVRFREIGPAPPSQFVAWFEPEHHIVARAAPFFARRFADMAWSILTPDLCAHWDGHAISLTPGVNKADAPATDRLEEIWLTYYANIFNPARLKTKAMQTEMPKKYWRNLPETALIKPLISDAGRTASDMIAADPTEPRKPQRKMSSAGSG